MQEARGAMDSSEPRRKEEADPLPPKEVQVADNTFTYTNNSEIVVTVVVSSEVVNNVRGTDTLDAEVRLVV